MKFLAVTIFVTLHLSVNTANGCGNISLNSLAVNGSKLNSAAEYPWSALLVYEGYPRSFGCGGVLVNKNYVLTTAECLGHANVTGVRLAAHNLASAKSCVLDPRRSFINCRDGSTIVGVRKTIFHPNHTWSTLEKKQLSNIALVQLKKSKLPPSVRLICLPGKSAPSGSDKYFVAGWGVNLGLGPAVRRIKHITQVERLNSTSCFGSPKPIFDDNFCMRPEECRDGWIGDQGGSLMTLDNRSRATLVGLVMGLSEGCTAFGNNMQPSTLYVDVLKHISWIRESMKPKRLE